MTIYEWKEPPLPPKGPQARLINDEILALLKSRPGEWLFIGRKNRSSWARSAACHASRKIEITSREIKGTQADIYLRWQA